MQEMCKMKVLGVFRSGYEKNGIVLILSLDRVGMVKTDIAKSRFFDCRA
jgi:hypothetical protein